MHFLSLNQSNGGVMDNWYVLYVSAKREGKISQYLKQNNLDVFIPKRDVIFKRQGHKFLVRKPVFSNYLFIKSSLHQSEFIALINTFKIEITGIIKVLKYDNDGTPSLSEKEKTMIERLFNKDMVIVPSIAYYENQRVIITDGPLIGLESKIIVVNRHKNFAKVAVDLFEREVVVEVPIEIITRI